MNADNLVTMANRIGAFFQSLPDEDEAQREVRDHLRKFWPVVMRRTLVAHAASGQTPHLIPLVQAAVQRYGAEWLEPQA